MVRLCLNWCWYRQWYYVEGVKSNAYIVALATLHRRLQLTVEKIDEDWTVPQKKPVPKLFGNNLVGSVGRVLLFYVGLLWHLVAVLMQSFEYYWKHLLAIVLGKSLKLNCSSCNTILHVPWRYWLLLSEVHVVYKFSEGKGKTTLCSVSIPVVNLREVYLIKEEFNYRFGVCQTLKYRVHEARIT